MIRPDHIWVPYGANKGKKKAVWKVPSKMLKWMAENYKNDTIATLADDEWQYREKYNTHFEDWS